MSVQRDYSTIYTPDILQSHVDNAKARWTSNINFYKSLGQYGDLVYYLERIMSAFVRLEQGNHSIQQMYSTMRAVDDQITDKINLYAGTFDLRKINEK